MAYGLRPRLFVENGPEVTALKAQERSSAAAHSIMWQQLPREQRIALVDRFLKAA